MDRQAHYVDLEAQPETGPNQADLRHLLPADSTAEPATSETASISTAQPAAAQPGPALNPTANVPMRAAPVKDAKSKPGKKGNKETPVATSTPPAPSIQDTATRLLQQVIAMSVCQCQQITEHGV